MRNKAFLYGATLILCLMAVPVKAQTFELPFVIYESTNSTNQSNIKPPVSSFPFVTYRPSPTQRNLNQVVLADGIYELVVNYRAHTQNEKKYELDVRIHNDVITHIYFNNGGSIHHGKNNSGYIWRGGGIEWNVDIYGNITSGRAIVDVTYPGGGWQLFTIDF